MKSLFLLLCTAFLFFCSCSKETAAVPVQSPESLEAAIEKMVVETSMMSPDGNVDQSVIFSEQDFELICRVENDHLNIWTDEDLRHVLPINSTNTLSYQEKLDFLRKKIFLTDRTVAEGPTREAVNLRWNKPPRHDSSPDIVAQTLAASGSFVGQQSSLNFWRPTFPSDQGTVTTFDITRSIIASNQQLLSDTEIEYDAGSIIWEYQVSGQNWIIGVDITTYDAAGQPTVHHFCESCPLGSLIWNPTLDSPTDDDVIQGPMPLGYVSISANGLTPPAPVN